MCGHTSIIRGSNVTCALEQLSLDITAINMYVNSYVSFCCQLIVCVSCYSVIHARAVSVAINVCSFCCMVCTLLSLHLYYTCC